MRVENTRLPGVKLLTPERIGDARGFFAESWNRRTMAMAGLAYDFVQDNHSLSARAGTLRGLHYQAPPHAQVKLVRCGRGRLWDVAVDVRRGSPTYGQWAGAELSFDNGRQLLVPAGFLHGFVTREPMTEIVYKCTAHHVPHCEGTVLWSSAGIDWGLGATDDPVLSERDATAAPFGAFDSPFVWEPDVENAVLR